MKHSHPNRWAYGGIVQRVEWDGDPARFRCWDGEDRAVEPGDTVLVLFTGLPAVTFVGVEGPGMEEA